VDFIRHKKNDNPTYYHPNNNKNLNIEANCCHGATKSFSIFKMRITNFVGEICEIMRVPTVGVA
jgi:hypothetical protein